MTICRMRIACWVPKATNMDSQYVTLTAFPQQQWLYKGASMLCCLSCYKVISERQWLPDDCCHSVPNMTQNVT
jgi:hypothetical protein